MSGTRQRTYTRQQWAEAQTAWRSGEFSTEWREWRTLAGQAGIIAAPVGTPWDQWNAPEPTERALVIRAIRSAPDALRTTLRSGKVHSWAQVIRLLLQDRDGHLDDVIRDESQDDGDITERQATDTLRRINVVLGRTA